MATETLTIPAHEVRCGDTLPGYGNNPIVAIEIHRVDWRFVLQDGTRVFWDSPIKVTVNRWIPIEQDAWYREALTSTNV